MIESKIINMYTEEIDKYGVEDRKALFWTKDKQDIRFNILLDERLKLANMSLLDFGCGVGDLKLFLEKNQYNLIYNGCDINNLFIEEAKRKHPDRDFFLIESVKDISKNFDIILVSGTFNLIGEDDVDKMEEYIYSNLLQLFERTNYMLSVNFLSHTTDKEYRYDGHFYLDPMKLYEFAYKHMTKRIKIDTGSLPYEITVKFYKDCSINAKTVLYTKN